MGDVATAKSKLEMGRERVRIRGITAYCSPKVFPAWEVWGEPRS